MKRYGIWGAAALFLVAAFLLGQALGGKWHGNVEKAQYETRYTLIAQLNGSYWDDIAYGALQEAERSGMSLRCISFERGESLATFAAQVDYAASAGVDGLIVIGGTGNEDVREAVARAQERGVPVVCCDTVGDQVAFNAFVGTDNLLAGQLAAQRLVEACGGQAQVLAVLYSTAAQTQQERLLGFEQALESYPQMDVACIISDGGDMYVLQKAVEEALAENPGINAIFSAGASASDAMGQIPSLKPLLGDRVKLVSFDMSDSVQRYIEEGLYEASVVQAPQQMGMMAVQTLERIRGGEAMCGERFYTEPVCVTRENMTGEMRTQGAKVIWNMY